MKTYLLTILFCLSSFVLLAQHRNAVFFAGHIRSDQGNLKLKAYIDRHYITGNAFENSPIPVLIDGQGNFSLRITNITDIAWITLYDDVSGANIFDKEIVEPGDSIHLQVDIKTTSGNPSANVSFSGSNSTKYSIFQDLGAFYDNDFKFFKKLNSVKGNEDDIFRIGDSILNAQSQKIEKHRSELSATAYGIMMADVYGEVNNLMLQALIWNVNEAFYTSSDSVVNEKRTKFQRFKAHLTRDFSSDILSQSIRYFDLAYIVARWEAVFSHPKVPYSLTDMCKVLSKTTTGAFRERMLAYLVINEQCIKGDLPSGTDQEEYDHYLSNAIKITRTPWLKDTLQKFFKVRGKGNLAFNFSLPADSTGRLVKLSDFKGKVVLIDMWGYQCTGCTLFAQAFHKAIYPKFQNNPDFKVISILTSDTPYNLYLKRLRGTPQKGLEKLSIYTFPDYTNLFGGRGINMGRAINNHYHLDMVPFIILVDRQGHIFSTTVPFFENTQSPNVNKLTALIQKALSVTAD